MEHRCDALSPVCDRQVRDASANLKQTDPDPHDTKGETFWFSRKSGAKKVLLMRFELLFRVGI